MGIVVVRRPERRPPPVPPRGEILLESPPEIPETTSAGFTQVLTYLPMVAGAAAMGLMFAGNGGGNPIMYVASGMFALSMVGMSIGQMGRAQGERKQRLNGLRRDYFRYLSQTRAKVRRAAAKQREALDWNGPDPEALWSIALSARLWERRPADADFGAVRVGTGAQRLAVQLIPPESKPVEDLDAMSAGALRRFVRAHSTVADLPIAVSLHSFARVRPTGPEAPVRDMIRALVAQLAVFHSPDELRIAVCASREWMAHWEWVKWLPHALHPHETDAAGPVRLMTNDLGELDRLLGDDFKNRARFRPGVSADALPYHVVIIDGGHVPQDSPLGADAIEGVTLVDLDGTTTPAGEKTTLRLRVTADSFSRVTTDQAGKEVVTPLGRPDRFSYLQADGLARRLAPLRGSPAGAGGGDALAADTTLAELLGLGDPAALEPALLWRPRAPRNRLRVPIGVGTDGRPVELDIKESAQGGMGPHGLVIGATGSGKSELLRTLVLGLAVAHSSEVLNFVLVDFKGGATFLGMDSLPHVSAVITNLADELPLVDRMHAALHGEMVRRQELLRATGNHASLRDYEQAREQGADLRPLPTLFVVLDEFSELLSAQPEFIELFVMIGRLGRSLGVHLLLASQRLEEGRLRGLDTHLSYRIGLRTFSAMESRVVLGVTDAYELPSAPGNAFLKFDTTGMVRFKAAYVSGPYTPERRVVRHEHAEGRQIVPYGAAYVAPPPRAEPEPEPEAVTTSGRESLLDVVVRRLQGQGPPAHRIWLPPLAEPPSLDELLPPLSGTPHHGLTTAQWQGRGGLHALLGVVDRPFEQRRDPYWLDLSGAAGHVAVAGGPQSGKSTVLRTLIAGLALTHTPAEVQFYCLDFGGGGLASLEGLPHVGGVANRLDADRVRRTVAEVTALLARREREFAEQGVDSIATYRRRIAQGAEGGVETGGFGDVFLVVDGWLTVRQEYESLEPVITELAARGLGYGVHVVAATNKWSEFRPSIRDLFGSRVELKLGDAYESEVNRRTAMAVPEGTPGRGLTRDGLHFLGALPRVDGGSRAEDLPAATRAMVEAVAAAWQGPPAPRVRLLPAVLGPESLPGPDLTGARIPLGIDESTLSPVLADFDADPHLVVIGDNESGKSNLLRLVAEGVVARHEPSGARLIVIDYRRSLLDAAYTEHRIGYAASSTAAGEFIAEIREALIKRLPPANLSPEELRSRGWWKGADIYIVVDDYDVVSSGANPLVPLMDLLPQARDIGLHLVLARAMGGAGRAMFDPVLQRLKDMATPAVMMSGHKDEGVLFGVRPHPLPPGRAYLSDRRNGVRLIQTAFMPPPETRK